MSIRGAPNDHMFLENILKYKRDSLLLETRWRPFVRLLCLNTTFNMFRVFSPGYTLPPPPQIIFRELPPPLPPPDFRDFRNIFDKIRDPGRIFELRVPARRWLEVYMTL